MILGGQKRMLPYAGLNLRVWARDIDRKLLLYFHVLATNKPLCIKLGCHDQSVLQRKRLHKARNWHGDGNSSPYAVY